MFCLHVCLSLVGLFIELAISVLISVINFMYNYNYTLYCHVTLLLLPWLLQVPGSTIECWTQFRIISGEYVECTCILLPW